MIKVIGNMYRKLVPFAVRQHLYALRLCRMRIVHFNGKVTYNEDGLLTTTNCDFMKDPLFMESYKRGRDLNSWGFGEIHWRAYVVAWAANRGRMLEGDFVECGVNKGGLSRMVIDYIGFEKLVDRKFYLLDTFHGLVDEYISAEEKAMGIKPGGFEECYEVVKKTFKEFPNVRIIRGPVPDTLPLVESDKVCYLSLDMNCAPPEVAAADFFWDRLVSGAVIVLDDYGWMNRSPQKHAMDEFALRKGVQVLSLPTGQGLIIKP